MTLEELIENLARIEVLLQIRKREGQISTDKSDELQDLLNTELKEVEYDDE